MLIPSFPNPFPSPLPPAHSNQTLPLRLGRATPSHARRLPSRGDARRRPFPQRRPLPTDSRRRSRTSRAGRLMSSSSASHLPPTLRSSRELLFARVGTSPDLLSAAGRQPSAFLCQSRFSPKILMSELASTLRFSPPAGFSPAAALSFPRWRRLTSSFPG
jgi:hypothetical protein